MRRKRDKDTWSNETKKAWSNDPNGFEKAAGNHQMKSSINGLFYNGYAGSPEGAEDAFGEAFEKTAEAIMIDCLMLKKL